MSNSNQVVTHCVLHKRIRQQLDRIPGSNKFGIKRQVLEYIRRGESSKETLDFFAGVLEAIPEPNLGDLQVRALLALKGFDSTSVEPPEIDLESLSFEELNELASGSKAEIDRLDEEIEILVSEHEELISEAAEKEAESEPLISEHRKWLYFLDDVQGELESRAFAEGD